MTTLPDPYQKEAQPFRHFDNPEDLARARVQSEIKSGNSEFRSEQNHEGWYGHHTEIRGDELIVHKCGGVEMKLTFNYQRLLREAQTLTLNL